MIDYRIIYILNFKFRINQVAISSFYLREYARECDRRFVLHPGLS
jgi:hypothetical protein